ncbi:MAG: hypothetical protein IH969_07890, partial [Candidatus Krumholzibacteriota bacterium]|nr:hypothetical protein [Candidatus Krumholzibacteriota bacterium]
MNRHVVRLGEAFARSRLERTPLAASGDNDDLWTHYIYTCLGDPEMPQWNNVVDSLGVSHVASVGLGTTAITVTVTASGGPVDSSFVCLSKAGEDYVVGSTDGAGQMTLDFRTESAGVIKVVTTGRNHARHESFITVSSTGAAYVKLAGYTVDDDSVGGTVGNGDGLLDAGETVDLLLSVENTGSLSSGSVDLIVRSSHGLITIIDSTAFVGTVNPSQTVMAADSIRVILSSSLGDLPPNPEGEVVRKVPVGHLDGLEPGGKGGG